MRAGRVITFASASGPADGWLVRPGPGRPGVIVLQEWWGLVPHIQDVVRRFAVQGYVAVAPDLYHGASTLEAAEARHLMAGLDWTRALDEIGGAIRHLRDTEGIDRIGVIGFCMGGALALLAATLPGVDVYAAFYGFPPHDRDLTRVQSPGLICLGGRDAHVPADAIHAFAARQRAVGRSCDVVVYPGAGHAFFNDDRPEAYDAAAANDAWRRTLELFGRHLRPGVG